MEVIAPSNQPILICGETGTGKELIARALHALSGCTGKFVAVNSAGLDDQMFSDALFGHRKGAFTGADQDRAGFIGTAVDGTLFLDEIGDLQESSQIKLLRLLQEYEYYPVGSDIPRKSRARIVAATNRNPKELVTAGTFRSDLYFRLCTHQIDLPPLRERREDLPLLVDHFLGKASSIFHKAKPGYPTGLAALLSAYQFPGNVRELEAMVFDAVARHTSGVLSLKTFRARLDQHTSAGTSALTIALPGSEIVMGHDGEFPTLKQTENILVAEAMRRTGNNQRVAAALLGISRQALNKRLNRT
jgi:DNA-binding NtrC family response regulator